MKDNGKTRQRLEKYHGREHTFAQAAVKELFWVLERDDDPSDYLVQVESMPVDKVVYDFSSILNEVGGDE